MAKKNTAVHLKSNWSEMGNCPGCSGKRRGRGGGTLKGMRENRRHRLSGERRRHEEEMLTAGRMKIRKVRSAY